MNIEKFRSDVIDYLETTNTRPFVLSKTAGVDAGNFYRFLDGKKKLGADSVFKLWNFIYREPVRIKARKIQKDNINEKKA